MAWSRHISVQDPMADVTECCICKEIFANPKSLPCIHSFCLICLEMYGNDKRPGDQIPCPICRSNFVIPNGGFCNLPSNFFISKMVEIRKLANSTTIETLCATCPEEERVKAKMFCFECEQNLCQRCGITHGKMKLSQYHQVVEIDNKPQEVTFRNSCCDQHPGEIVKMYCEDDKATICIICFAESHQTHKCLNIAKASEEFSSSLKNDLSVVKRRIPECRDSFEKLKKLKTDLLADIAEAEKKILNEATRLKAFIDSQTNVLMQKLTAIKIKKLKEVERTQQDVERFQITIESYTRYLNELLNKGAPGDICREANQVKKRARELTALPGICCGCDCCWYKIMFKTSNLEDVLRINNIANVIGDVPTGESSNQLLGHTAVHPKRGILKVASRAATGAAKAKKPNRTIVLQNIPAETEADSLHFVFGGNTETIDYEKGRGTAFITFKDSAVADAWAMKGFIAIRGTTVLIKKWQKPQVYFDGKYRL